jgi:hypothetical protein
MNQTALWARTGDGGSRPRRILCGRLTVQLEVLPRAEKLEFTANFAPGGRPGENARKSFRTGYPLPPWGLRGGLPLKRIKP